MTTATIDPLQRSFAPEARLVLACARTHMDSAAIAGVQSLLEGELDWRYVTVIGQRQRVMPLLSKNLPHCCSGALPDKELTRLQDHAQHTARWNLLLATELLTILGLLESEGIEAMPLKGPALAADVYGDLSLRPYADLDLLLDRSDVPAARRILGKESYVPNKFQGEAAEAVLLRSPHAYHYSLSRTATGLVVELHWNVVWKYFQLPLDFDAWRRRRRSVVMLQGSVRHLAPEDLLIFLCVYGTKDCWRRLSHVCDVAECLRAHPELAWDQVDAEAHRLHAVRMLDVGLLLSERLLGAPLPPRIHERVSKNRPAQALAAWVCGQMFDRRDPRTERLGALHRPRFHTRSRERVRDRARYYLERLFSPSPRDLADLHIPSGLGFMRYCLRPLRLLGNMTLRVVRGPRPRGVERPTRR